MLCFSGFLGGQANLMASNARGRKCLIFVTEVPLKLEHQSLFFHSWLVGSAQVIVCAFCSHNTDTPKTRIKEQRSNGLLVGACGLEHGRKLSVWCLLPNQLSQRQF